MNATIVVVFESCINIMVKKICKLYVLYKLTSQSIPSDAKVLSFLMPEDEYEFTNCFKGQVLSGRKEMDAIRESVRLAYIDMVARISSTPCNGQTLRQALALSGKGNPWWYTNVSFKGVESDPTFNIFLHVFTISNVAEREKIKNIVLRGAPREIKEILSSRYTGSRKGMVGYFKTINKLVWGTLSRIKFLVGALHACFALRLFSTLPDIKPDIVFQGFWDWSVYPDKNNLNLLSDMYFKSLPERLKLKGFKCSWFLWLLPDYKPATEKRSIKKVLNPVKGLSQLIFLQKFLTLRDIVYAFFDLRALYRYLKFCRSRIFKEIFILGEFDFFPFFNYRLICDFAGSSIPRCMLIECASRRAFAKYRPKASLTFLEFYLHSRALYHGGRLGNPETIHFTVQHASYNREKTFLVLDREKELCGKPDNCAVPVPDYIFAMGELGREIFLEDGFTPEKVLLTGSSRYEHIKVSYTKNSRQNKSVFNILLVPTLFPRHDFEMVQAVSLAVDGLQNVKLYIRSHPFARMEDLPEYRPYRQQIISTKGTLENSLELADLVIFTYSTVAEEALLLGVPVWQWQTASYNGSVFRELKIVPSFYTVSELNEALKEFISNPNSYIPSEKTRRFTLKKCFYSDDGKASERIADQLGKLLNPSEP